MPTLRVSEPANNTIEDLVVMQRELNRALEALGAGGRVSAPPSFDLPGFADDINRALDGGVVRRVLYGTSWASEQSSYGVFFSGLAALPPLVATELPRMAQTSWSADQNSYGVFSTDDTTTATVGRVPRTSWAKDQSSYGVFFGGRPDLPTPEEAALFAPSYPEHLTPEFVSTPSRIAPFWWSPRRASYGPFRMGATGAVGERRAPMSTWMREQNSYGVFSMAAPVLPLAPLPVTRTARTTWASDQSSYGVLGNVPTLPPVPTHDTTRIADTSWAQRQSSYGVAHDTDPETPPTTRTARTSWAKDRSTYGMLGRGPAPPPIPTHDISRIAPTSWAQDRSSYGVLGGDRTVYGPPLPPYVPPPPPVIPEPVVIPRRVAVTSWAQSQESYGAFTGVAGAAPATRRQAPFGWAKDQSSYGVFFVGTPTLPIPDAIPTRRQPKQGWAAQQKSVGYFGLNRPVLPEATPIATRRQPLITWAQRQSSYAPFRGDTMGSNTERRTAKTGWAKDQSSYGVFFDGVPALPSATAIPTRRQPKQGWAAQQKSVGYFGLNRPVLPQVSIPRDVVG